MISSCRHWKRRWRKFSGNRWNLVAAASIFHEVYYPVFQFTGGRDRNLADRMKYAFMERNTVPMDWLLQDVRLPLRFWKPDVQSGWWWITPDWFATTAPRRLMKAWRRNQRMWRHIDASRRLYSKRLVPFCSTTTSALSGKRRWRGGRLRFCPRLQTSVLGRKSQFNLPSQTVTIRWNIHRKMIAGRLAFRLDDSRAVGFYWLMFIRQYPVFPELFTGFTVLTEPEGHLW